MGGRAALLYEEQSIDWVIYRSFKRIMISDVINYFGMGIIVGSLGYSRPLVETPPRREFTLSESSFVYLWLVEFKRKKFRV